MEYKLPPLPEPGEALSKWAYDERDMQAYAIAAIEAQASVMQQEAASEIDRLNAQRRELQAERERLLDSLARAGLEASRMVRQERHEIAQWLDGQGQPGYAHDVRFRA